MKQKPFDDFAVGEVFQSYARTITEADIVNFTCFAGLKLPLFIDEEFCKKHSPFGTRIVPGLMTASFAAGMMEDILGPYTIAALSLDGFRFIKPRKAGDTMHVSITVEDKRDTKHPERGILSSRQDVVRQDGKVVLQFTSSFMMRKGHF